jgi:hypothetical protein
MAKYISSITPTFRLVNSWRCFRTRNITNQTIKSPPTTDPAGCVYLFTCSCEKRYVGETSKNLKERLLQHQQDSRESAIHNHRKICNDFNVEFKQKLGANPTQRQRHEFFFDKFQILRKNIFNWTYRTYEEGIFITLLNPQINNQNEHRKVKLII